MTAQGEKPKAVLAWYASQFADLIAPMARHLREQYGVNVILLCYRESNLPNPKHYTFDRAAFAEIISVESVLYPRPAEAIGSMTAFSQQAVELEKSLSMTLVEILRCDRHLGIDFVTGADFYTSHFDKGTTFLQKLDIASRLCRFFGDLLDRYDVMSIMATPGDIGPASLIAVAEGRGIPMQQLIRARSGRRFYFTRDRHCWPFGLESAYERQLASLPSDATAPPLEPPQAAKIYFSGLTNRTTVRFLVNQIVKSFRREAGRRLKRAEVINREYYLSDRLRLSVERWFFRRRMFSEVPVLPDLEPEQPFVFFPLAVEPESSLMVESQVCDNQLSFLDWVAKTVPSGWIVLVKEHPAATAPRPRGFWERVRRYPNIRVLATLEPGETVAIRSKAIATINGSLGIQAAAQGVPLLTCHPRYVGTLLPHGFLCRRYEDMRDAMMRIRSDELPAMAERRRAAAALLSALDLLSYPLEDIHLLRGVAGGEAVKAEQVSLIADTYMQQLVRDDHRAQLNSIES